MNTRTRGQTLSHLLRLGPKAHQVGKRGLIPPPQKSVGERGRRSLMDTLIERREERRRALEPHYSVAEWRSEEERQQRSKVQEVAELGEPCQGDTCCAEPKSSGDEEQQHEVRSMRRL